MANEPSSPGSVPPATPVSAQATTVTSGTLIMGTYQIERLISAGGMGEVYRGHNIHNGEPVAIKIVLPSLAHDPKIVALFQKESTVLSRLSHEAIVRYHVFTNDPTIGRPCMVMEFVSGTAMSDRIEQGPMPLDEVKVMLRRVASGLDKAHRAGVVHRDMSPDNVILEEGRVEHAKLIDFGIAKSSAIGAGTLLQGQFAGKFNWVSPEQLGAFGGVVDGRSDIYSLALITAAASRGEVLQMGASIVDAVGKRSAVPDLSGVDPALVPLLAWMLNPDPAKRPESMAAVIAAVENPALVPVDAPPKPEVIDPNRTVIGGALPIFEAMPPQTGSQLPVAAAPAGPDTSTPPVVLPSGSGMPLTVMPTQAEVTSPPEIAAAATPAPLIAPALPEPDDVSPFGAPAAPTQTTPAFSPAAPAAKKGKGGMVAVLAVLALGGGAAGAYFGGVFTPKATPIGAESQEQADARVKVDEEAKAQDQKAAEEEAAAAQAAAAKEADEKAAADLAAAEKAAAEQAAALEVATRQAAENKAAAEKAAEQKAAAELAAAEKAAADRAEADRVEADRAAAEKAATEKAESERAEAARVATEKAAADQAAAELAAAAKAAAEQAALDKAAADQAAAEKAAAEQAASEKAAAEQAAAEKAAADQAAAEQAAAETRAAAEKAAAEKAEAKRVEAERVAAEKAEADRVAAEQAAAAAAAQRAAEEAAAQQAMAEELKRAEAAAAKKAAADAAAKAEAERVAAEQAAAAAAAQLAAEEDAAKSAMAEELKRAEAEAAQKAAAEAAVKAEAEKVAAAEQPPATEPPGAAPDPASETSPAVAAESAAQKAAEDEAARKAQEDAAKADPIGTQMAFLVNYLPPACTFIGVSDARADGFVLNGYAADPQALAGLAEEWKTQTYQVPTITTHLITASQCAALDFASLRSSASADGDSLVLKLDTKRERVKSGATVSGKVDGLDGRFVTLFIFSEAGGATNLQPWTTRNDDGSVSFSFDISLLEGADPAPQVLLALATDTAISALDTVPSGVTAQTLVPYLEKELDAAGITPAVAVAYFRLEP